MNFARSSSIYLTSQKFSIWYKIFFHIVSSTPQQHTLTCIMVISRNLAVPLPPPQCYSFSFNRKVQSGRWKPIKRLFILILYSKYKNINEMLIFIFCSIYCYCDFEICQSESYQIENEVNCDVIRLKWDDWSPNRQKKTRQKALHSVIVTKWLQEKSLRTDKFPYLSIFITILVKKWKYIHTYIHTSMQRNKWR